MEHIQKELSYKQKLEAISCNYYSGVKDRWEPKAGDYYTTPRNDLQLYRIVREDEKYFYTVYCNVDNCTEARWEKSEFLNGFGVFRIWVMPYIFEIV